MLPSYYFQEVKQLFAAFIRLTLSNFISTAHLRLFPNQSLSTRRSTGTGSKFSGKVAWSRMESEKEYLLM